MKSGLQKTTPLAVSECPIVLFATLYWGIGSVVIAGMPQRSEVGPAAMPQVLAPVVAPFEFAQPVRPQFPERAVRIAPSHAPADNSKPITAEIQTAIDDLSTAGGGTVILSPGIWHTGRLLLKTGVNLHIETGATLKFSGEVDDYLPLVFTRTEGVEAMGLGGLIYAHRQQRIAITGGGTLVGPDKGPVRRQSKGLTDKMVPADTPVAERRLDGREGRHYFRPYFINLVDCQQVLIEGVTLRNGPMWNVVPVYCDGVVIRGVTVDSRGVVNGDGFNIDSSRNVLIEYCSTNTGDDCYAIKSGRDTDGLRVARPAEKIVIRNCYASGGFGGFTCGSETAGGVRDVYVRDCLFENVRHAIYFKTRRPRGGGGERITAERIGFNSTSHALFFDMIGSPMYVGELGNRLPRRAITPATPYYRDITIRELHGESTEGEAFKIKGIPESPAQTVRLERSKIASRDFINLTDAANITVAYSQFDAQNPTLKVLDSRKVRFIDTTFRTAGGKMFATRASKQDAAAVEFKNCTPTSFPREDDAD